ncbi:MAG: carbohydrate ABC transporter permease, partial [Caldilinea sp.]
MSKRILDGITIYGLLMFAMLLTLIPVAWMISTSLKTPDRVFTFPIEWLPETVLWENYVSALTARPFGIYLINS